ncbi:MAG: hypothetical protein PHF29_09015 [Candidatus Riflebacteria bacterium]|nr:hypothetical protein [Candidatus Riflebacteria bacterium]
MKKLFMSALLFVFTAAIITYAPLYAQENTASSTINTTNYVPIIPKIENEKAIDTLYPDPLSDAFRKKSKIDDKEKGKSVSELISEFEAQAAKIASNTVVPVYVEDKPPEIDEFGNLIHATGTLSITATYTEQVTASETLLVNASDTELLTAGGTMPVNASDTQSLEGAPFDDIPTDDMAPDDSFYETGEEVTELSGDQIPVDDGSEPLPDMVAQTDDTQADTDEEIDDSDDEEISDDESDEKAKKRKKAKEEKKRKEKNMPFDPFLITDGNPALDQLEITRVEKLKGYLIPEIHPVSRRKNMFRWVIKLEDETLIPIRSSLKILQEVNDESLFENEVEMVGRFQTSSMNKNIRYFIADSIEKAKKPGLGSDTADIASGSIDIASGSVELGSGSVEIAGSIAETPSAIDYLAGSTSDNEGNTAKLATDTTEIGSDTADIAGDSQLIKDTL